MPGVVILGVFNADTTYRAPRLPRMGETMHGDSFALGPGGKGSNQAVAAARAGAEVHFVSRLGADDFGRMARELWSSAGVIPAVVEDPDRHTGAALIFVDSTTGDNAIIIAPGAAAELSAADMDAQADLIGGAAVFVTQLEQPPAAARRGLEIARAGGAVTVLNPAPAEPLDDDLLALCDWLTPNEGEAGVLAGIDVSDLASAEAAARALIARGAGGVAVTLGADGVLLVEGAAAVHVPGFKVDRVVETTGAGDTFNGAFAAGLAEGMDPEAAARFGCAAAAISVTRPGAAASSPERADIEALMGGQE